MADANHIKTISALGIPVQIFILFLVKNKKNFTVTDVIIEFQLLYKINLPEPRTRKILNDLVSSDNLIMEMKPNGMKNKKTAFYTFNKLI